MDKKTDNVSQYIFPVSATMIGVCMTVISLMQIVSKNAISPFADDLLAIDSLLFLLSCLSSYWGIRRQSMIYHLEKFADRLFLVAMTLMVFVSFLVAFDLLIKV